MSQEEQVVIDKLVVGGQGLGRLADGMVVLVEGVLPGERVTVHPGARRGGYRQAELVAVLEPSPDRVVPPCPHFGRCGGCDFQHVASPRQASVKGEIFLEQLTRQGLQEPPVLLAPLAAPDPFHYRQRIRLQVAGREFGFRRARSHQLEPVTACLLARPEINEVLGRLESSPTLVRLLRQGLEIELMASPRDGDVVLLVHFQRKPRPADCQAAQAAVVETGVTGLLLVAAGHGVVGPFGGDAEALLRRFVLPGRGPGGRDLLLAVEPGGFSQVNPAQNVNLVGELLAWAGRPGRVLDCHCGMGNFSLPLAAVADEVIGCDVQGAAIRSGRRNATANGLGNCRFEKRSARDFVGELVAAGETFDTVLLDPPRQGCADIVPQLPSLKPQRLIYISCDPATLVRDLATFSGLGYATRRLRVVDMFPQTHHLEAIALIEPR